MGEGGHDEARVGALGIVLGLDDDASQAGPGGGLIGKLTEVAMRRLGRFESLGSDLSPGLREREQAGVLSQADDIIDIVAFAPGHQQPLRIINSASGDRYIR